MAPKKNLKGKPYPDQILYSLKQLKIKNQEACYIGDTYVDFKSAKDSKVKFIFAKYGYGQLKKSYLNIIKNINEVKKFVL